MRVLVVEDEPKLGDYLYKGLTEHAYVVDVARNGVDGQHMAIHGEYDILVLDIMLPAINGFEVLAAVRECKDMPVLMLTARDKVEDRVKGLQGGADDYLVKPFSFSELLARIQALLRRGRTQESPILRLRDLEMDLIGRRARRGSDRLNLTSKEFTLLALLLRRQGQVLSRTVLAEQVWDMHFDSDTNVIDVAVRRLRARLDDPHEVKLLHTVRGMGYVLEERDQ